MKAWWLLLMSRSRSDSATTGLGNRAERGARTRAAAQRRASVDAARARRAYERAQASDQKERARLYTESRIADVAALNERLADDVAALEGLLGDTLELGDFLDFESLKETVPRPRFDPGQLAVPEPAPLVADFQPPVPGAAQRLLPGAKKRYGEQFELGRRQYETAVHAHQLREAERLRRLEQARSEYQRTVTEIEERLARQHAEIEAFKASFEGGEPDAVIQYFAMVLERSHYPDGFPQLFRLAYIPESHQLVVQYSLPTFDRVPAVAEYRYVKTGDKVTEKPRPLRGQQDLYKRIVAALTVRTLHEIFNADRSGIVETVAFNGHVDTVSDATGKEVYPCLVTLMTTRDSFMDRDFSRVDPLACLLDLSASVSKNPAELVPVRPVLEFDMVDPRFVEEADVLSGLDQRPNLMELSPGEFESLITNLFTKMGLETRMTQPSRDGGIDCVTFDNRPIFGGRLLFKLSDTKILYL